MQRIITALFAIPGKDTNRVSEKYEFSEKAWKEQYDMLLLDKHTCADCVWVERCVMMNGGKPTNRKCDYYPNRFKQVHTLKLS